MEDYIRLVQSEIEKNYVSAIIPNKKESEIIKDKCRDLCKTLHAYDKISKECLHNTVGVRFDEKKEEYGLTRHYASQFNFDFDLNAAHVYPLFKTHKEKPDNKFTEIGQIPMRLVTAANRVPLARVMAMLEFILAEPMKIYCGDEYTKDSPSYLKSLTDRKVYSEKGLSIVCLDVVALYPNASRELTLKAVRECLSEADWNPNVLEAFLELVQLCMERIYIKFNQKGYTANSGIITGAPNSVSIANCMVRYITKRFPLDTSRIIVWKRFIDDIICFIRSRDQTLINNFVDQVIDHFKQFQLDITVRFLNPDFDQLSPDTPEITPNINSTTANTQILAIPNNQLSTDTNNQLSPDTISIPKIEFLDIDHSFDHSDHVQTQLHVKETAKNSTYLHPSSYHPRFIPAGILKGELIRVRKISSNNENFKSGVEQILAKAERSSFTDKIIDAARTMVENWGNEKRLELLDGTVKDTETDQSVVWVSQLPFCIKEKFLKVSKDLLPEKINLRVTFQKPPSLKTILSRPRALEVKIDGCEPCGHCKLCGNYGKIRTKNMVATSKNLKIKNKTYKINGKLNCKSCGIYVAVCKIQSCQENYVGQTITGCCCCY